MKNNKSYLYLPLLLLIFSVTPCAAQIDSTVYSCILKQLQSLKEQYAPDSRSKILELAPGAPHSGTYIIQSTEKKALEALEKKLAHLKANISLELLPDSSVQQTPYGVSILSVANLRTQPGHNQEMATQILLGTLVDILQQKNGEYRVRTPEGYIAWVPTTSIAPMDHKHMQSYKASKKIIFTQEFGKSFSAANTQSQRVSDLVYGNILSLIDSSQAFYQVAYADGREAYIAKDQACPLENWLYSRKLTAENLIQSGKSMLGLPYLWGGTSVKGVDCSGFTKTAFFMNGYIIPRDASQQVLAGDPVAILDESGELDEDLALKNLKPADLLFFAGAKNKSPNPRVTHVALYIGNGQFIQSAGRVRINSLLQQAENYDALQASTIVAAKRYIGSKDPQIQAIHKNSTYIK